MDQLPQIRLDILFSLMERKPEAGAAELASEAELLSRFVFFGDTGQEIALPDVTVSV